MMDSEDTLRVTIYLAWRRLSAFCSHQHVEKFVYATTRTDHCSHLAFCRVLELELALTCMHFVTLIDSHACHKDARR